MPYSSIIKEIVVDGESLRLLFDDELPSVEFENQIYRHIWILCQHCTSLTDPTYLKQFAEISNFLWKGTSFEFIDDIEEYQKFYSDRIKLENEHLTDVFPYRLTDYKLFDVSMMHEPRQVDECLHFYVRQTSTGLPYRVVCPFPYTSPSPLVHYQILPIKEG